MLKIKHKKILSSVFAKTEPKIWEKGKPSTILIALLGAWTEARPALINRSKAVEIAPNANRGDQFLTKLDYDPLAADYSSFPIR